MALMSAQWSLLVKTQLLPLIPCDTRDQIDLEHPLGAPGRTYVVCLAVERVEKGVSPFSGGLNSF